MEFRKFSQSCCHPRWSWFNILFSPWQNQSVLCEPSSILTFLKLNVVAVLCRHRAVIWKKLTSFPIFSADHWVVVAVYPRPEACRHLDDRLWEDGAVRVTDPPRQALGRLMGIWIMSMLIRICNVRMMRGSGSFLILKKIVLSFSLKSGILVGDSRSGQGKNIVPAKRADFESEKEHF